jgi:hypothetical protein
MKVKLTLTLLVAALVCTPLLVPAVQAKPAPSSNPLAFTPPPAITAPEPLRRAWAETQLAILQQADPMGSDSFSHYWRSVIAPRYGLDTTDHYLERRRDRREPPDLYSIFTGAAAIQESLQLEALAGSGKNETANVPLASLSGPTVKSHPFKEMLAGRTPALPELASWIPADQYAVFFSDLSKQRELADLLDEWGGNLLRQVEPEGKDFHIREKLTRQLCLEESWLSKMFGDRVVGSMAFSGSDPFLKEGTDFTLLFTLKDPASFRKQIQKHYDAARSRGAVRSQFSVGSTRVMAAVSPDRRVSSYAAIRGNIAVVSTSRIALEQALAVADGKLPGLASSEDFRYMRTIYAQGAKEEDVFVYLSDPYIRQLVGPRAKIGEARRLRCSGNLTLIANARLWFKAEQHREPTYAELAKGGYLGKQGIVCPDSGHYEFDPQGEVHCSLHNRTGWLTPVAEVPLTQVTPSEANEYRTFVSNYNRYWTKFFDPIGIRIKLGETIRVETCILPLIENSWYDGLAAFSGGTAGPLSNADLLPRTVVSLRSRIMPGWLQATRQLERSSLPLDWLGNDLNINLCDGPVLFTAGNQALGLLGRGGSSSSLEPLIIGYLVSAINLPTYLTVGVTDPVRAAAELPQLLQALGPRYEERDFWLENYAMEPYRGRTIHVATLNLWVIKLRLYTAVVGDRLVIASRRDIVTDLIDASASGKPQPTPANGSAELALYRYAFKDLAETAAISFQEENRHACHDNLPLVGVLLRGFGVPPEQLSATALVQRGYAPSCPVGGQYRINQANGNVECSFHGSRQQPRQPAAAAVDTPTMKLVNSLDRLTARLKFTPEGLMTTVEIKRNQGH